MKIKAVLLLGGSGRRFESETPKQFHELDGKQVYRHTLDTFLSTNIFDEIILVCPHEIEHPEATTTLGGPTRQASSYNGLLACGSDTDIVCIHDAVRPLVPPDLIKRNVELAKEHGAVNSCIPSRDTLVHTHDRHLIHDFPDREKHLRGQTPQTFLYYLIRRAHEHAINEGISDATDDCQLVHRFGHPIHITKGSEENLKITTPLDLTLAEALLQRELIRK